MSQSYVWRIPLPSTLFPSPATLSPYLPLLLASDIPLNVVREKSFTFFSSSSFSFSNANKLLQEELYLNFTKFDLKKKLCWDHGSRIWIISKFWPENSKLGRALSLSKPASASICVNFLTVITVSKEKDFSQLGNYDRPTNKLTYHETDKTVKNDIYCMPFW